MSVELPNFPNILGSPRWVEVARDRERILQARIAELEADAERYRWLRKNQLLAKIHYMPTPQPERLDAVIDAARGAK